MKSGKIINEDINEAPVGLAKKMALKVGSKVVPGKYGQKMKGSLDTGKVANTMQKAYYRYLGRIGEKPTTQNLSDFTHQVIASGGEFTKENYQESSTTNASEPYYQYEIPDLNIDDFFKKLAQLMAKGGSTTRSGTPLKQPGLMQRAMSNIKSMIGGDKSTSPIVEPTVTIPGSGIKPAASKPMGLPGQGGPDRPVQPPSATDNYIQNWAKAVNASKSRAEKIDLAKEVVNYMIDRYSPQLIRGDVPKFAKPEIKANAEKVKRLQTQVASTLKRAKINDPRIMKSLATGVKLERRDYGIARKMLESLGLTWRDLDIKVVLSESATDYVVIKSI